MATVNRGIIFSICGFALAACLSTAGVNIFLGICYAALLAVYIKNKEIYNGLLSQESKAMGKYLLLFLGALFLSVIFSFNQLYSLKEWWGVYASRMIPFLLIFFVAKLGEKKHMRAVAIAVNCSMAIASVYAMWQFYHGNTRPGAFLKSYMFLGSMYACIMPFSLIMVLEKAFNFSKRYRILNIICYVLGFGGMLANNTRGVWIAVACISILILLCYAWKKREPKYIAILLVLAAVSGTIVVNNNTFMKRLESIPSTTVHSNHERLLLWRSSVNMAKDYPVLGVGVGQFAEQYQHKYILPMAKEHDLEHAHNMFFHLLAEGGMVGLLAYILLFGKLIISNFRDYCRTGDGSYLLTCAVAASMVIHGCTEFNTVAYKIFWLLIGWGYALRMIEGESEK